MVTKIIAFDGIHRSGKNTQIKLLQEKMQQLGYEVFSGRGEYYREGNGDNNLLDPYSERWQKNKLHNNYEEKSNRLQRELYYFLHKKLPQYIEKNNFTKNIVILERSVVGKYLFNSGENNSTENNNIFFQNKNKLNKYLKEIIIPDIIFVLQPSKEEVLKRLLLTEVDTNKNISYTDRDVARLEYKKIYIPQKYDGYYNGLSKIPEHIYKKIHHIKSDADIETIHKEIIEKLKYL